MQLSASIVSARSPSPSACSCPAGPNRRSLSDTHTQCTSPAAGLQSHWDGGKPRVRLCVCVCVCARARDRTPCFSPVSGQDGYLSIVRMRIFPFHRCLFIVMRTLSHPLASGLDSIRLLSAAHTRGRRSALSRRGRRPSRLGTIRGRLRDDALRPKQVSAGRRPGGDCQMTRSSTWIGGRIDILAVGLRSTTRLG